MCISVYMYICSYICVYMLLHMCVCVSMCILYMYICTYKCIYICNYIYIYVPDIYIVPKKIDISHDELFCVSCPAISQKNDKLPICEAGQSLQFEGNSLDHRDRGESGVWGFISFQISMRFIWDRLSGSDVTNPHRNQRGHAKESAFRRYNMLQPF